MKKLNSIFIFLASLLFLITTLFSTCKSEPSKSGVKEEGVIEFETKGINEEHPLYSLAPNSATLKFKKEKFAVEMSTMGLFNTTIIGDLKAKTQIQTIKFMDINEASIENAKDIENANKEYELKIEETNETKKIANLNCIKLNVSLVKNPSVKFEAWYTKDLGLENCNSLNPYASVKGVLMDYRLKKMGLELHFLAKSYKNVKVPDNTFEISPSLKIVSKEEISKLFSNFQ